MVLTVTQTGGNLVASSGFLTYNWYKQNVLVPGANSAVLTPPGPGTYHVVVTDMNGCSLTSNPVDFPAVGVEPSGKEAVAISFYPNPSTGRYRIQVSKPMPGPISLTLYDLHGRVLRNETLAGLESGMTVDFSELPVGAYIIELKNKRGSLGHYKLIRQ